MKIALRLIGFVLLGAAMVPFGALTEFLWPGIPWYLQSLFTLPMFAVAMILFPFWMLVALPLFGIGLYAAIEYRDWYMLTGGLLAFFYPQLGILGWYLSMADWRGQSVSSQPTANGRLNKEFKSVGALIAPENRAKRSWNGYRMTSSKKTRYAVVLEDFGDRKIGVIKIVREATGLSLKDTKDLVEGAPSTVKQDLSKEDAQHLKSELQKVGASASITAYLEDVGTRGICDETEDGNRDAWLEMDDDDAEHRIADVESRIAELKARMNVLGIDDAHEHAKKSEIHVMGT